MATYQRIYYAVYSSGDEVHLQQQAWLLSMYVRSMCCVVGTNDACDEHSFLNVRHESWRREKYQERVEKQPPPPPPFFPASLFFLLLCQVLSIALEAIVLLSCRGNGRVSVTDHGSTNVMGYFVPRE